MADKPQIELNERDFLSHIKAVLHMAFLSSGSCCSKSRNSEVDMYILALLYDKVEKPRLGFLNLHLSEHYYRELHCSYSETNHKS